MLEKLIFIVGPHGVGKTYTTNQIKMDMNVVHFDLGPMIRDLHRRNAPSLTLKEWIQQGEFKLGKNFSDIVLCQEIRSQLLQDNASVVITGSRSLEGVQYIMTNFPAKKIFLFYLDADISLLKKNYENREGINISNDSFKNILLAEQDMGLLSLREYVLTHPNDAFYIVNQNNSTGIIEKIRDIINGRRFIVKHNKTAVLAYTKGVENEKQ